MPYVCPSLTEFQTVAPAKTGGIKQIIADPVLSKMRTRSAFLSLFAGCFWSPESIDLELRGHNIHVYTQKHLK